MEGSKDTSGGRPVDPNLTEKTIIPNDESMGSVNPTADANVIAPPINTSQSGYSHTSGPLPTPYSQEHTYFYGGYDNNGGVWDDYQLYANANNLQILSPAMYNDNASLLFHSGYGMDGQMAYGQFSPMASPFSPILVDGQLYSPHQHPVPPPFLQPPVSPGLPNVTSSHQIPQNELAAGGSGSQERLGDNVHFGLGSGYYIPFGSFGEGVCSGDQLANQPNLESGSYLPQFTTPYPPPYGILGPYEQNIGQFPQQQGPPSHGFGSMTNSYAQNNPDRSSYQSSNYNAPSNWRMNNQSRLIPDRGARHDKDRGSVLISEDGHVDRNRGPRALKPKVKRNTEETSSSVASKNGASNSESNLYLYNQLDFVTDYENAKFFVIKSYSEENVHKSIKYKVWASTTLGNRKLDAAFREVMEMGNPCPLFLLFSVNASGQFCGVAEMVGPVDFEHNADYWQQDRWSGQFPVRWHMVKDVPNIRLRHIPLENNENKPVTHSRDTQEVNLEQGLEILKIFKEHEAESSLLDDFPYYDEKERSSQERKARQRPISSSSSSVNNAPASAPAATDVSIDELSDRFTETFKLEDGKDMATPK